jgi:hypothetical protein
MCHGTTYAVTPDTAECSNCGARESTGLDPESEGPVLLGFVHLEPRDVQAMREWWEWEGGTASIWGDQPALADLLCPATKELSARLQKALDDGEDGADDAWLVFHDEVVRAATMVQAMFVAGASGASYCWEHHGLRADRWHTPDHGIVRCCRMQLMILGIVHTS